MAIQGTQNKQDKQSWKRRQSWRTQFLTVIITKLQWLGQCGTGIKIGIDQWNPIENPETNPHIYGQLLSTRMLRKFKGGNKLPKWSYDKQILIYNGMWFYRIIREYKWSVRMKTGLSLKHNSLLNCWFSHIFFWNFTYAFSYKALIILYLHFMHF